MRDAGAGATSVVRAARPADVPALVALCAGQPGAWSAPALHDTLAQPQHQGLWLLQQADGAAGAVVVAAVHVSVLPPEAEVVDLWVHPSCRRRGHAARLWQAVQAQLTAAGVRQVHLEVARANAAARALYHRLGFACVGVRRAYYAAARLQGTVGEGALDVGGAYADALQLTKTV